MNDGKLYRESMELWNLACDIAEKDLEIMKEKMVDESQSIALVTMLAINLYKSVLISSGLFKYCQNEMIDSICEELKFNLKDIKQ